MLTNVDQPEILYREQASRFAKFRDENFTKSRTSYQNGNKKKAKDYSEDGKRYQRLMDEANKKASQIVFSKNNQHFDEGTIDLHGLFVIEAIEKLKARIASVKRRGLEQLIVIVGKGNNSKDGPKIKPAVIKYARENRIQFIENSPNPGCVCLELSQARKSEITTFDYLNRFDTSARVRTTSGRNYDNSMHSKPWRETTYSSHVERPSVIGDILSLIGQAFGRVLQKIFG